MKSKAYIIKHNNGEYYHSPGFTNNLVQAKFYTSEKIANQHLIQNYVWEKDNCYIKEVIIIEED